MIPSITCPPRLPRCLCTTGTRLWMWKASQWMRCVMVHCTRGVAKVRKAYPLHQTTSTRKKRRVRGNFLLRGTEGPICWTDPSLSEVCCLPRAWVKDITRKLPSLVRPSDYYPLLLFHVGGNEAAMHSPRAIQRLQGLGTVGKGIWSADYFSLSLSSCGQ